MLEKQKPKTDPDILLQTALKIDWHDLADNHQGRLSRQQRWKVQTIPNQLFGISCRLFIIGSILSIFGRSGDLLLITFIVSIALFFLSGVIPTIHGFFDSLERHVLFIEGRVKMDIVPNLIPQKAYRLYLNDHVFYVPNTVFVGFRNGDHYRIYYTPRTKWVVAAEWLPDDDPFLTEYARGDYADHHTHATYFSEPTQEFTMQH